MKRGISVLLAVVVLASLTTCHRASPNGNQPPASAYEIGSEPPTEISTHQPEVHFTEEYCAATDITDTEDNRIFISFEELETLGEEYSEFWKFMSSVHVGMIIRTTWNDANDVDAHLFPYFFTSEFNRTGGNFDEFELDMRGWLVPAEIFEPFIQAYFDVTTDHLRTARTYVPDENVYIIDGVGSATSVLITSVEQQGDVLILGYDVFGGGMVLMASGRLFIQVGGETHRFLSNEIEWFE